MIFMHDLESQIATFLSNEFPVFEMTSTCSHEDSEFKHLLGQLSEAQLCKKIANFSCIQKSFTNLFLYFSKIANFLLFRSNMMGL